MIAKEVKRGTDQVHRDMSEVIVNEGQDVNVTLAHHAAWTDERFEGVEERLGGLDLGLQTMEDRLAGKIDGLALRIDKVLALAIRDEAKLAEILKEADHDKK